MIIEEHAEQDQAPINALELGGNYFKSTSRFRIDDSVIAHNVFKPGSFLDITNRLGPIASEVGASHRLDFSDNVADGAAADYLYSPGDARGWRAGFFFHMNDDHEMLLISAGVLGAGRSATQAMRAIDRRLRMSGG